MLLVQKDADGTYNVIMDGYISTGYKTYNEDGVTKTVFAACYKSIYNKYTKERTYRNAQITVYGENNARMIAAVKREKDKDSRIIILGVTDRDPDDCIDSGIMPRVKATAILPITEFVKMRDYTLGALRYDANITRAAETRYDYITPENESDHML